MKGDGYSTITEGPRFNWRGGKFPRREKKTGECPTVHSSTNAGNGSSLMSKDGRKRRKEGGKEGDLGIIPKKRGKRGKRGNLFSLIIWGVYLTFLDTTKVFLCHGERGKKKKKKGYSGEKNQKRAPFPVSSCVAKILEISD